MSKRRTESEPAPGQGEVLVQTPVVRMLKHHGIEPAAFIRAVRRGRLADESRTDFTEGGTAATYPDLPVMKGSITWHRNVHAYRLKMDHLLLHDDTTSIRFWSSIGRGLSQISIGGATLADSVIQALIGQPLNRVVDHPWLDDDRIVIRSGRAFPPVRNRTSLPWLPTNPGTTEFHVEMPTEPHPDHA